MYWRWLRCSVCQSVLRSARVTPSLTSRCLCLICLSYYTLHWSGFYVTSYHYSTIFTKKKLYLIYWLLIHLQVVVVFTYKVYAIILNIDLKIAKSFLQLYIPVIQLTQPSSPTKDQKSPLLWWKMWSKSLCPRLSIQISNQPKNCFRYWFPHQSFINQSFILTRYVEEQENSFKKRTCINKIYNNYSYVMILFNFKNNSINI